jgi:lactate dehydrogenase-like 2-hydroxyacid dehydrogenase
VGFEHVNIAAAKRHGLVVTNTPYVLSDATAEVAIMLMVGASRRAGEEGVRPGVEFIG